MEPSRLMPVSLDRIARAVEKVHQRLLRGTSALDSAGIPYAVIGGNAVAAWVSRIDEAAVRNTRDVDILIRREDLDEAIKALTGADFHYRHAGGVDVFLDGDNSSLREGIHVVFAEEFTRPDHAERAPEVSEVEPGGSFRLVRLEALVRMKLTSFRDKDRMHLRDLIRVDLVDDSWAPRLPELLAQRLRQILDDPDG